MAKKAGRKSKYDELHIAEKLDAVRGWAKHGGATAVAKMLGVSSATVSGWKGKYADFAEALMVAEKEANGQLLASAFDLATGYEREVNEVIKIRKSGFDERGNKVTIEEEKVVTYKVRVKYNGEERELSGEELVTAAQKGLNYDKVVEERDKYRKDNAAEALRVEEKVARRYGMTREEYRKFADEHVDKELHDEELKKVRDESPGISEKLAEEIVTARIAAKGTAVAQKAEAAEAAPWEALAAEYPEIKSTDDIPEDVKKAVSEGKDPLLAMREHEIASLKADIEKMKAAGEEEQQNNINAQRATGRLGKAEQQEPDEIYNIFMRGLT